MLDTLKWQRRFNANVNINIHFKTVSLDWRYGSLAKSLLYNYKNYSSALECPHKYCVDEEAFL